MLLGALALLGGGAWLYSLRASASEAPASSIFGDIVNIASGGGGQANVAAFLALVRTAEAAGDYHAIAGGGSFASFAEHPFIADPSLPKPLGTTASGAYQMVKRTWTMARDALGLTDFSPASQDAAAVWILQHKVPGAWTSISDTGNYELVAAGNFDEALRRLAPEWESLQKIAAGSYYLSLADARALYTQAGGALA